MNVCDKYMICVAPASGISFEHEYRAMKEIGDSVYIMNDVGAYKWYNKTRFVEREIQ